MSTDRPPALWRVMFLAERYGRMTLTLDEVAEQVGLAAGTIRNRRTRGEFTWLRTDGRQLTADVADVAAFLEQCRSDAQLSANHSWSSDAHAPESQRAGARRRNRSLGKG